MSGPIRTMKAFEQVIAQLARGEVDSLGASDHLALGKRLRAYRDRAEPDRFAELTARIVAAEAASAAARPGNRYRATEALIRAQREARGQRPF